MEKNPRKRKKISANIETKILASSARRCALCFFLSNDLNEKLGQIAHLDQDSSNGDEDNLLFMCLQHHTLYDSKTSQHKNYSIGEVKAARANLYKLVAENRHFSPEAALPFVQMEADRRILSEFIKCVPSAKSISFLRTTNLGAIIDGDHFEDLQNFLFLNGGPEYEFLNSGLEELRQNFRNACNEFYTSVAMYTQPLPQDGWYRIPTDLRHENPELYREFLDKLHNSADQVVQTYDILVRTARQTLSY